MEMLYHGSFTPSIWGLLFFQLQAIGEVAIRVAQLEQIRGPGQPSPGLSLKVEYTDSADARKQGVGSLSQSVEALERFSANLLFSSRLLKVTSNFSGFSFSSAREVF